MADDNVIGKAKIEISADSKKYKAVMKDLAPTADKAVKETNQQLGKIGKNVNIGDSVAGSMKAGVSKITATAKATATSMTQEVTKAAAHASSEMEQKFNAAAKASAAAVKTVADAHKKMQGDADKAWKGVGDDAEAAKKKIDDAAAALKNFGKGQPGSGGTARKPNPGGASPGGAPGTPTPGGSGSGPAGQTDVEKYLGTAFENLDKKGAKFFDRLEKTGGKASTKIRDEFIQQLTYAEMKVEQQWGSLAKAPKAVTAELEKQRKKLEEITKVTRELKDAVDDEKGKINEAGVGFNSLGDAIGIAAGKYGGLVAKATIFLAATKMSYDFFRKIGEFIGTDYQAMEDIGNKFKEHTQNTWKYFIAGRAMNTAYQMAHMNQDARLGLEYANLNGLKTVSENKGYGEQLIVTEKQVAALGKAMREAAEAGPQFERWVQLELFHGAKSVEEAVARAEAKLPYIEKIVAEVRLKTKYLERDKALEDLTNERYENTRSSQIALADAQGKKQVAAELRKKQALAAVWHGIGDLAEKYGDEVVDKYSGRVSKSLQLSPQLRDTIKSAEDAANAVEDFNVSLQEMNDRLATDQLKLQNAQAKGLTEETKRLINVTFREQEAIASKTGKTREYIAALEEQRKLALQAADVESKQRDATTRQLQEQNAEAQGNFTLARDLTQQYGDLQIAIAMKGKRESELTKQEREYLAALKLQKQLALDAFDAERVGREISIVQTQMSIATMKGEGDEVRKLTDKYNALVVQQQQLQHKATAEVSITIDLQGVTKENALYKSQTDFRKEMLAIEQQLTQYRQTKGLNVAQELKDEAAEEYELKLRDLELTEKTEEQKKALRLKYAEEVYAKLADIDFQYGQDWQHMLQRQSRAFGTSASRMEEVWTSTSQSMSTAFQGLFFDVMTGNLHDLSNVFKDFVNSILQAIAKAMADAVVQRFITLAISVFGARFGAGASSGAIAGSISGSAAGAAWGSGLGVSGHLASGGIVTANGIFEMAEQNKPEAVIPLESERAKQFFGGAGSRDNQPIDIHQKIIIAPEMFGAMRTSPEEIIAVVNGDYARNGVTRRTFRARG